MAHMIDETTGQAAVFVMGEAAWHKLGKIISSAVSSDQAIKLAILDWLVEKQAMFLGNGNKVPGRFANVRSDTGAVLGVVGKGYQVCQNKDAFNFMDSLVGDKLAMFETAGSLDSGKRVWMLARIPKELKAAKSDIVKPYLLVTNGHDGSHAVKILLTSVRVVCNNTLNLALGNGRTGFSIFHNTKLEAKVEQARKVLGIVIEQVDRFQEQMQALAARSLKQTEVTQYFQQLFPTKPAVPAHLRKVEKVQTEGLLDSILSGHSAKSEMVRELLAGDQENQKQDHDRNAKILEQIMANYENRTNTLPGIKGSAWAAFNAVSEYADHQKWVTGKTDADKANNRLKSVWFGQANEIKQEAYSAAVNLLNN
jgi:phage/plasmid-like protein (TIGR03299 family)